MQLTYRKTKTCNNACIGGGMSLRAFVLIASVFVTGCSNPMFERGCSPGQEIDCSVLGTFGDTDSYATVSSWSNECETDPYLAATDYQSEHPTHMAALPFIGSRFKSWGAQATGHLQNNFITRAVDAHKARRLAKIDAKNAPPWPTFHPIPTRPVFFPDNSQVMDNESEVLNSTSPTANYGQFEPAN